MKHIRLDRILALLLAVALVCATLTPVSARAETVVASGDGSASADSGIAWALYQTDSGYLLKLTAADSTTVPATAYQKMGWASYVNSITAIWIAKEITEIGKQALAYMPAVETIEFEENSALTTIGVGAFRNCEALTALRFGDNLKSVGKNAFLECTALTLIDFGRGDSAGVSFGDTCTKYCASLKTLVMPEKIKSIGSNAFYQAHALATVYWYGASLEEWDDLCLHTSYAHYLADRNIDLYLWDETAGTFCTDPVHPGIRQVGEGVTAYRNNSNSDHALTLYGGGTMESYATGAEAYWSDTNSGSTPLTKVIITQNVTAIGANAFADCAKVTGVYYLGTEAQWEALKAASGAGNDNLWNAYVHFIGSAAIGEEGNISYRLEQIEGSEDLRLVISGDGELEGVNEVKEVPWYEANHMIAELVIEEGITAIGTRLFARMRKLSSISIPGTVDTIHREAFRYLPSLTELTLPEGVTTISHGAFSVCYNLETLNLPTTLRSIDMKAFMYDVSIKYVNYAGTEAQWKRISIDSSSGYNDTVIYAIKTFFQTTQLDTFADAAASEYLDELQELYEWGLVSIAYADGFGTTLLLTDEEIYTALYIWAGSDSIYENATDWATQNGLLEGEYGLMTGTKLGALLEKVAAHNGQTLKLEIPAGEDTLTREEGLHWLYLFLNSDAGRSDRYDQLVATIKAGLEENLTTGNGKLYIITPNLYVENLGKKVGDCTLIIFPDGQTMIIDAGVGDAEVSNDDGTTPSTTTQLVKLLKAVGITELDYFVLTHRHSDHYGGCKGLFNYLSNVKNYWYGASKADSVAGSNGVGSSTLSSYLVKKFGTTVTQVEIEEDSIACATSDKNTYTIGGVTVNVFGPTTAVSQLDEISPDTEISNNTSVCLKFTYGDSVFLACGDIYISREEEVCAAYGDWLKADVVKANHHGNVQSTGQTWVDTVQAKVYLAEIDGNGNAVVAARVAAAGGEYYTTGYDGMMVVAMSNDGTYDLQTQYDSTLRRQDVAEVNLLTITCTTLKADGLIYSLVIDLATGETLSSTVIGEGNPGETLPGEDTTEPDTDPAEPDTNPTEPDDDDLVPEPAVGNDGNNTWIIVVICVLCAAAAAVVIVIVKKKKL